MPPQSNSALSRNQAISTYLNSLPLFPARLGPQVATIRGVMTTVKPAPAVPRENPLQAEAATVERLRRQIAEMPAKGEVASPELLSEFARAQKSYLDKKIGFEMQRRKLAPSGVNAPPPALQPTFIATPSTAAASSIQPAPAQIEEPAKITTSRILLVGGLIALIAAVIWFVLSRG